MTRSTTIDALKENERSLNDVIDRIRSRHYRGVDASAASARYLEYLRGAQMAAEKLDLPTLWPVPFSQIVGVSASKRKRLEWRGWFRFFERAPVQFLQAAE